MCRAEFDVSTIVQDGGAGVLDAEASSRSAGARSVLSAGLCEVCVEEVRWQLQERWEKRPRSEIRLQETGWELRPCREHPCDAEGDEVSPRSSCGAGNQQESLCSGGRLCQVHQGGLHPTATQPEVVTDHPQTAARSRALQDFHQHRAAQTGGQVQTDGHGLRRTGLNWNLILFFVVVVVFLWRSGSNITSTLEDFSSSGFCL